MARGSKTPDSKIQILKANMLIDDNVSKAAKAAGLPQGTAKDYAAKLKDDNQFQDAKKQLDLFFITNAQPIIKKVLSDLTTEIESCTPMQKVTIMAILVDKINQMAGQNILNIDSESTQGIERTITIRKQITETTTAKRIIDDSDNTTL